METSVEAAEVLVTPQPNNTSSLDPESSESEAAAAACAAASSPSSPPSSPSSSSSSPDPMEEFSRQLKSIIHIYGSAASLLDKQCPAEVEKVKEEAKDDITGATETEVSLIMQSLNELASPEEKLDDLVRKYAELAALRRCDAQKLVALQQKLSVLLEERQELQAERRSSVAARSKLEALCREQQSYYNVLREEMLQRCREDESKRTEITTHFQSTLAEIQSQIELHSARNDKLCRENISLTDKLENLMTQCERREESLEKINKHRDLQHKLTEAKLHQANALLAEAEEKHKREKEYLLREAIDKTKKCFAMKEQELAMKKKLTLYGQKFDEFQATLAKSNEIYARFKQEMENMSAKMKKMEKESTLWKTRFENCNKALTDMIEERTEKGKEYDLFVLRIQKLEKLCRALQDERKVLYDKIKDVRNSSANLPSKLPDGTDADDEPEGAKKAALLTPDELQEIQEEDPVLTEDMSRLKEEQAKLQEFAATLLAEPVDYDEEENEVDLEEDLVTSVFVSFKTKPQMKKDLDLVPEQVEDVKSKKAESKLPQPVNVEKVAPTMEAPTPQEKTLETTPADPNTEVQQPIAPEPKPEPEQAKVEPPTDAMKAELLEEPGEEKPVVPVHSEKDQQQESTEPATASDPGKSKADLPADTVEAEILEEPGEEKPVVPAHDEKDQQPPVEPVPMPETEKAKADPLKCPEVMKAEILEDTTEVKPVEDKKVESQTSEPVQAPENASPPSESASENTWKAAGSSDADSSKKQVPKKKKKRSNKNAS